MTAMHAPEVGFGDAPCWYSGDHHWHGKSICSQCGARLRCDCGQFVRADRLDEHLNACPVIARMATECCEHDVPFVDFCARCAHRPAEEWGGYPMTICSYCIKPWPCDFARAVGERQETP